MPFAVLLVPFFIFSAAIVIIALSQTSAHTSTHAPGFSGFLDTIVHNNILTELAHGVSNLTRRMLSKFAASHLKMVTAYLHGLASLLRQEQHAMRANAQASARVAAELDRAIPIEARKAAAPAHYLARVANRHALRAKAEGRLTAKELHTFREHTRARLRADAHAIDVTIPRDIGALRRRTREVEDAQAKDRTAIGELEHGATKTFEWIRSHPLSAVTGVFTGAVAVALARLGFGFLRCRQWRNVGRRITCGMGSWLGALLDLIATFALALLGVLNPDVLARVTVRAVDEIEPLVDRMLATTTNEKQIEQDVERLVSWLGIG